MKNRSMKQLIDLKVRDRHDERKDHEINNEICLCCVWSIRNLR
jgi:hypothetical protein